MKDSCIIAPIHSPDFQRYGLDWVRTYDDYFEDNDIFLIFSNEGERDNFEQLASSTIGKRQNKNKYNSIVCEEPLLQSPITQKKFYGLKHIFENTQFKRVGVVDVDTIFLKNIDYDRMFEESISNGKIYASHTGRFAFINESSLKFFNGEDQKIIKNLTQNSSLYFWFNDIPVYSREHYLNFLKYIDYENKIGLAQWHDFDFIMYAYYLLTQQIAELVPIKIKDVIPTTIGSFIENQHLTNPPDFEKIVREIRPMWLKYEINPSAMDSVFMRLHIHSPHK